MATFSPIVTLCVTCFLFHISVLLTTCLSWWISSLHTIIKRISLWNFQPMLNDFSTCRGIYCLCIGVASLQSEFITYLHFLQSRLYTHHKHLWWKLIDSSDSIPFWRDFFCWYHDSFIVVLSLTLRHSVWKWNLYC